MVFSSIPFIFIYLPVVLALYYICPVKWRNILLFAANMVFYGWSDRIFLLLILFSITVNFVFGHLIGRLRNNDRTAKYLLVLSVAVNLAPLLLFKYFDPAVNALSQITLFGGLKPLKLALPIGLSFYTFKAISYSVDVYRGDAEIQKNYINFGNYIALFPQLTAGPIVRYKDLSKQLRSRVYSAEQFSSGVRRFVAGLVKKVLIANNLGALWDVTAKTPMTELTCLGAWTGIIAFSLQLYFDFSGYSDMAIGLGQMFGFKTLENFNYPYISKSVTDFWRRWHISLGTWFRDYVYIPLGGNRCSLLRQFLNILVVWALTGSWHGANWTFLLWGLYYALFLMLEKSFLLKILDKLPGAVSTLYAVLVAVCGWVLFQVDSVSVALGYYKAMFGIGGSPLFSAGDIYYLKNYLLIFIIAIFACAPLGKNLYNKLPEAAKTVLAPILIVAGLVISTAYLVDATYNPFLYFRF